MQRNHQPDHHGQPSKVPEVTLVFWAIKIAATTFGEAAILFALLPASLLNPRAAGIHRRVHSHLSATGGAPGALIPAPALSRLCRRRMSCSRAWSIATSR